MSQPVFRSSTRIKAVDLIELAKTIEERFMPAVFVCECNDTECIEGRQDPVLVRHRDTALRIAAFIRSRA